ncbi:MAG: hypothetical protein HY666_04645 [Chloroflexi bacterium]|nr:hypothetical protein [Chloroflexota bacterium]
MAKNITFDLLSLQAANIWIDVATGDIRLEVNYLVSSSADGISLSKSRECQGILTDAEKTTVLNLASRLKSALEAQELV